MGNLIDAKGKACPIPFMLAKQQIDLGNTDFRIEVDNLVAVENLRRLARSQNYTIDTIVDGNIHRVHFRGSGSHPEMENVTEPLLTCSPINTKWTLFIGKDYMGEGEHELGRNLMRMFLYTIDQGADQPTNIILMNKGVLLAVEDDQTVATLESLQHKGSELLVCGTCLDYYHLDRQLKTGIISNMYDIAQRILEAGKVITL
jgi:selenium metabolism protein YedF